MSGRPKVCQFCLFRNWIDYFTKQYPSHCERCQKDLNTVPPIDEFETVNINGRLVTRRKPKNGYRD